MSAASGVRAWVEERIPPSRRAHQGGVVEEAARLAARYGQDLPAAELCAWLHDSARYLPLSEQRSLLHGLAQVAGVPLDDEERAADELLHAPASAVLGRRDFGIEDASVLRAARLHTTGAPGMEPLALLLYVADYIEPSRTHDCAAAREAAGRGLEEAALAVVEGKIAHLVSGGARPHPRSLALREELRARATRGGAR